MPLRQTDEKCPTHTPSIAPINTVNGPWYFFDEAFVRSLINQPNGLA